MSEPLDLNALKALEAKAITDWPGYFVSPHGTPSGRASEREEGDVRLLQSLAEVERLVEAGRQGVVSTTIPTEVEALEQWGERRGWVVRSDYRHRPLVFVFFHKHGGGLRATALENGGSYANGCVAD